MGSKLELRDILQKLEEVNEWQNLGIQLGVESHVIERIRKDSFETSERKTMILRHWLNNDRSASWEKLAAALDVIDHKVLASEIRQQIRGDIELDKLAKASESIDKAKREIQDQSRDNVEKINQSFDKMFEDLQSRKKSLLEEEKKVVGEKLNILDIQQKKLQASIAALKHQGDVRHSDDTVYDKNELCLEPVEKANVGIRVDFTCTNCLSELCKIYYLDPKVGAYVEGVQDTEVKSNRCFTIHTTYSNGQPCQKFQKVEAKLLCVVDGSSSKVEVSEKEPGVYEGCYCPTSRGRHQLSVQVNEKPIADSPFSVFVAFPPSRMKEPVRVIDGVIRPASVVFTKDEQMWVNENDENQPKVSLMDRYGKRTGREITHEQFKVLGGLGVNETDIYVTDLSTHYFLKFDSDGKCLEKIGGKGCGPGQFNFPAEPLIVEEEVFLSDFLGHRVQVFNKNLQYIREFGSKGSLEGEFNGPGDLAWNKREQHIYLADINNRRIQVLTRDGKPVRSFGGGVNKLANLKRPLNICLDCSETFLLASDYERDCVFVFKVNGEFVNTIGSSGSGRGHFSNPTRVAFDADGFLYVCDKYNNRIQVF